MPSLVGSYLKSPVYSSMAISIHVLINVKVHPSILPPIQQLG